MLRKINSIKPITIAEAKKILEEKEKNLNALQLRVLDYGKKFSKMDIEKSLKVLNILINEYQLLPEEATQIVDICPTTIEELRAILSGYRRLVSFLLFSEDKMKKIVELIKSNLEENKEEKS
ncbi:MAG: hypothetical protein QXP60_04420 [Nitrososphaerota archaeon]